MKLKIDELSDKTEGVKYILYFLQSTMIPDFCKSFYFFSHIRSIGDQWHRVKERGEYSRVEQEFKIWQCVLDKQEETYGQTAVSCFL